MELIAEIEIDRPPAEVFAFLADMSNNPQWQRGMQSCEWTSPLPIRVGSTYSQRASFLGRPIITEFEVAEYETDGRIRITSTKSTFPLDITRTVEPAGEGSRVRAMIRGEPGGIMGLLAPITKPLAYHSIQRDYRRLKELLEAGAPD